MIEITPSQWKCRAENNFTIHVSRGSNGGIVLTKPNGEKQFVFAESKPDTIQAFGEMFIKIAEWAKNEDKNNVKD